MFSSLVSLKDSTYNRISQQVIDNLNLAETFAQLLEINEGEEAIIYQMCQDIETINFRQAIMKDFITSPELLDELVEQLKAFGRFRFKFEKELNKSSKLYYLIELLLVVEASVDCLESLFQTLCYYPIASEGLLNLRKSVETMMATDQYKKMKVDRKAIRYIFKQIKSVEVSINMNTGMRPYEAQITDVNTHSYRYPEAFRKVSDALEVTDMYLGKRTRHYAPLFSIERVNLELMEEIEYALKDHKTVITNFLNNYNKIDAMPFIHLHEEVTFYNAGMSFYKSNLEGGLWMCFPEIKANSPIYLSINEAYNLHLGNVLINEGLQKQLIANTVTINKGDVILLTGANRGGKTTFTQLVGQVQVLAQLGFPVPAKATTMSICHEIASHFPMIEQAAIDFGHFGRACYEFKEAFNTLDTKSLLLMNESFSGTSHLESIEIASEVVKALLAKGITTIYNTHLHELYGMTKDLGNVKSFSVGDVGSAEMYKIIEKEPRGFSQALEIAKAYGMTYALLLQQLGGEPNES